MNSMLNLKKAFIISIGLHGAAMLIVLPLTLRGDYKEAQTLSVDLVAIQLPSSTKRPESTAKKEVFEKKPVTIKAQSNRRQSVKPRQNNIAKKTTKTTEIKNIARKEADLPLHNTSSEKNKNSVPEHKLVKIYIARDKTEGANYQSTNKTNRADNSKKAESFGLDFTKAILSRIDAAKLYPRLAIRRGMEGAATIKFRVSRDGEVDEISLVKSSGFGILDRASIKAVKKAAPFPYFDVWLKVAVSFKLT